MTETLAPVYSSESGQLELSNEYQHDRVLMGFKNLCVLVLWIKVVLALEGLKNHTLEDPICCQKLYKMSISRKQKSYLNILIVYHDMDIGYGYFALSQLVNTCLWLLFEYIVASL